MWPPPDEPSKYMRESSIDAVRRAKATASSTSATAASEAPAPGCLFGPRKFGKIAAQPRARARRSYSAPSLLR